MTAYTANITDSHTVSDSISDHHSRSVALSEAGSTSDNPVRLIVARRTLTNTASASDSLVRHITFARGITNASSTTDTTHRAYRRNATITESSVYNDVLTRSHGTPRLVVESSLTFFPSPTQYPSPALYPGAGVTADTLARVFGAHRHITDHAAQVIPLYPGTTLYPATSLFPGNQNTTLAPATDTLVVQHISKRTTVESLAPAHDMVAYRRTFGRAFSETETLTVIANRAYGAYRRPLEALSTTDGLVFQGETFRRLTEEVHEATDRMSRRYGSNRFFLSVIPALDSIAVHTGQYFSIIESFTVRDNLTESSLSNHLCLIHEYLTTADAPSLRFLLPVEGSVIFEPNSFGLAPSVSLAPHSGLAPSGLSSIGTFVGNLPDWGFVLIEGTVNAMYWQPTIVRPLDPMREK